jgi:hypothetical protein
MIKIYKLVYHKQVVYVGQTKLPLYRRKAGSYHNIDKEYIKKCEIEIIEETDDVSRERYWIKYYRDLGCNLLNKNDGDYLNEEQKKIIRNKKNNPNNNKKGRPKTKTKKDYLENRRKWYDENKDRINKMRREKYKMEPWYIKTSK